MADFTGKRIVVTGGAGGIGVETVRAFMDQGGHVIMCDRDDAALQRAQEQLGKVRLGLYRSDLETPEDCAKVIEAAAKTAGKPIALKSFVRFVLGDGIEKEESDFAAEVAAVAKS